MKLKGRTRRSGGDLFADEHGLTTTAMVLSLLVTLSLLFTAMQVYRIESASADVQDVADAAALAAENQVAEFMLVARFCDAIVLSMSLTGITVTGLGIAALCTPATATISSKLIEAGEKVIQYRNKFSKHATKVLNKLQEALPYFAAACSVAVAEANDSNSPGARYLGVAILVPTKGEKLKAFSGEEAEKLADDAEEQQDEIREEAEKAEKAAQEANKHKERAFDNDCGNNPDPCMFERVSSLTNLDYGSNPLYSSIDTWSFSVALRRAQAYYRARRDNEKPNGASTIEQARSALRYRLYTYAVGLMDKGYVHETSDSFTAYFPLLPKNTVEMRETSLYTEKVYLVTEEVERVVETAQPSGGAQAPADAPDAQAPSEPATTEKVRRYMHAYDGCPKATGSHVCYESVSYMESNDLETCPECQFSASRLGSVASATTSTSSGFEHYYREVAAAAEDYEREFKEAQKAKDETKDQVGDLLKQLKRALKETAGARIEPVPPGRFGAVSLVVNIGTTKPAGALEGAFVAVSGKLGPRAAISASTLVDEGSDEGRTIINSVLDGLREDGGAFVGAAGILLDAWSWMLSAYGNGQEAIINGVKGGLNALPLVGASGLGDWVSDKLEDVVESVGLQPAEIAALKPVVVNSAHVVAKGESAFSSGLLKVKQRVVAHPQAATDLFSAFLTDAERAALDQVKDVGDSIEIASIELLGDNGPSIPITIPIPDAVKEHGVTLVQEIFGRLRSWHAETMEVRAWE